MEETQNGPTVRFLPGQKTQLVGAVRVTNPPGHSGSGFWPGNKPNRTESPAKNQTAGRLPGPVTNTIYDPFCSNFGGDKNWNRLD
jgi:hypothetical protein